MSCPDDQHVDNGGATCAACEVVLPRVRAAIAARRPASDGKTCLHRYVCGRLQGQACGARNGKRGAVVVEGRCGRHRARKRKAKEKSRWQLLEID